MPSIEQKLSELASLPSDWDGDDALPIHADAIARALVVCRMLSTPPEIVPLNNGTVQLEWHCHDYDLEIEVGKSRTAILLLKATA